MDELQPSYQDFTLITYPINSFTLVSHCLGYYLCGWVNIIGKTNREWKWLMCK